jgi:hypothetical protein
MCLAFGILDRMQGQNWAQRDVLDALRNAHSRHEQETALMHKHACMKVHTRVSSCKAGLQAQGQGVHNMDGCTPAKISLQKSACDDITTLLIATVPKYLSKHCSMDTARSSTTALLQQAYRQH